MSGAGLTVIEGHVRSQERPLLLDLFCCSGIGALGYYEAGFEVVGVDIGPQPNYPFEFHQADAVSLLDDWRMSGALDAFDAIHASPPCQAYSDLQRRTKRLSPRLIGPTRMACIATGLPYVIENVEGSDLVDPTMLCGTMFPGLRVLRHRLFETNWTLTAPPHGDHPLVFTHDKRKGHFGKLDQDTSFVQVTGGGNCTMRNARAAMGLPTDDRRTKHELNEGIPPAYTLHIGTQLLAVIEKGAADVA